MCTGECEGVIESESVAKMMWFYTKCDVLHMACKSEHCPEFIFGKCFDLVTLEEKQTQEVALTEIIYSYFETS